MMFWDVFQVWSMIGWKSSFYLQVFLLCWFIYYLVYLIFFVSLRFNYFSFGCAVSQVICWILFLGFWLFLVAWMIPIYLEVNRFCRSCFPGVVTLSVFLMFLIHYYESNIFTYGEKWHVSTCHFYGKSVKDLDFAISSS